MELVCVWCMDDTCCWVQGAEGVQLVCRSVALSGSCGGACFVWQWSSSISTHSGLSLARLDSTQRSLAAANSFLFTPNFFLYFASRFPLF